MGGNEVGHAAGSSWRVYCTCVCHHSVGMLVTSVCDVSTTCAILCCVSHGLEINTLD